MTGQTPEAVSGHQDPFARQHLPPPELWPNLEFNTPELRYPERLNAGVELIDVGVARHGAHRPALRTPDGEVWTYAQLQARSNQIAHVLVDEFGHRSGNRVLLRSPNNPWTVAVWLAVLKAGGVVVTTMAALRAGELTPIVQRTEPRVAVADHRLADDLYAVRDDCAPELQVLTFGSDRPDDLTRLAAGKPTEFTAVDTAADDVALFCPTSGTTGVPKITTHFHRDLLSIDNTFATSVLRLQPDDLVACTAPLAFTFGLGMLVVFTLRAGASALLVEAAAPADLADLVAEHRVTVLATAPTAYKQILSAGRVEQLRGLRVALSAGEHLPEATWHQLEERIGLRVIDGIGATEMLHIFISAAGDEIRPGATGTVVPGFRAAILDADGNELGPGVEGRLAVIGPVGCRYLDDERQRDYVVNGWNVTGDTFLRDQDGYFYYRSRTDNLIVSSGYNIGGPEVEEALLTHPDVVEAGVVGAPDPDRGQIVCAFVVLRDPVTGDRDTAAKAAELQDYVKGRLAPYKYPRAVRFLSQMPRNTNGKLQHFRLRQLIESEDRG